ncbi:MAG: hypothetical protein JKX84_11505 [Flavobacteriales bacterium]|nr:hypothetical protein [Flavobacteriales bacterium]
MVNFIYLAHSKVRFRKQAVFSILSLLEYVRESSLQYRIIVYTDESTFFEPLGVTTRNISTNQLNEWKGEMDFVHRGKIRVMQDAAENFDGKLFFLDSDNCIFSDPTIFLNAWKDDTVIMEKLEYVLRQPADLVGKKYKRFFRKQHVFKGAEQKYDVSMDQQCWNSGIVGLPEDARTFLPDVLAFCDDIHGQFRKHLSEQMAFSIVLSQHFKVEAFKPFTYHWFGHGQAINKIIDEVFLDYPNADLEHWIRQVSAVKERVIAAPLNADKLPWYKRWFS